MTSSLELPNGRRKSIAMLLDEVLHHCGEQRVLVSELIGALGTRGYGFLILILDLPNLIPLPLPGLSIIFGVPMALIGLQMMLGLKHPWIPKAIMNRSIDREHFEKMFARAKPILEKVERVLRPRWLWLTHDYARPVLGLAILAMAFTLSLPIPLGNLILAIPIGLLALGLIERDGVFVALGLFVGAIALSFNAAIVALGVEGVLKLFS